MNFHKLQSLQILEICLLGGFGDFGVNKILFGQRLIFRANALKFINNRVAIK